MANTRASQSSAANKAGRNIPSQRTLVWDDGIVGGPGCWGRIPVGQPGELLPLDGVRVQQHPPAGGLGQRCSCAPCEASAGSTSEQGGRCAEAVAAPAQADALGAPTGGRRVIAPAQGCRRAPLEGGLAKRGHGDWPARSWPRAPSLGVTDSSRGPKAPFEAAALPVCH